MTEITIFSRLLKWAGGFTTTFWLGLCALLLVCIPGAYLWGCSNGKAIERGNQSTLYAKALHKGQKADDASHQTVTAGNDAVRASNDKARKAAEGADDPLKASMDSLRGKK